MYYVGVFMLIFSSFLFQMKCYTEAELLANLYATGDHVRLRITHTALDMSPSDLPTYT